MSEVPGQDSKFEVTEAEAYHRELHARGKQPTKCGDCPGPVAWCNTCAKTRCWNSFCPTRDATLDPVTGEIRCATCKRELEGVRS